MGESARLIRGSLVNFFSALCYAIKSGRWMFWCLICLLIFFSVAPLLWLLLTSFSANPDKLTAMTLGQIVRQLTFRNYVELFRSQPMLKYIINSTVVASITTFLTVSLATLAGYAFARVKTKIFNLMKLGILMIGVFPGIVLLVPLFGMMVKIGLYDNLLALALIYTAFNLPFGIWVLSRFFEMMPRDLEDAALLDGFSKPEIVFRFVVPLSLPAIASVALLTFMAAWNEFLFAFAFIQTQTLRTVPVGIALITGTTTYEVPWGQITAAVMIAIIPLIIATLIFERWIIYGLTAGAIKG